MSEMAEWYYTNNRQPIGPVSIEQLRQLASNGILQSADMVWKEGLAGWAPASSIAGLFLEGRLPNTSPAIPGDPDLLGSPPYQDRQPTYDPWKDDEEVRPRPRSSRRRYQNDDEEFAVPRRKRYVEYDDDEDLRLPRRGKSKSNLALILTLIIGGFVLLLAIGIVMIVVLIGDQPAGNPPVRQQFNLPGMKNANLVTIPLAPGKVIWNGELTMADGNDPVKPGCRCKIFLYPMTAGKTYTIDLQSQEFDAFLGLEDANGVQLAFNDDAFPGTLDAQIVYTATKTGQYRIIATTCNPGEMGRFLLKITP